MALPKPLILVAESQGFSKDATALLRRVGRVLLNDVDRTELLHAVAPVDVLWVRLRHHIDEELMERAPRLKVIVTPTTGLNHIDMEEAARRGIRVLSLRGETEFLKNVHATAEHTVGLILSLLRHIPEARAHVVGGGWSRDGFRGSELAGKTVGIVGYGRLGRIISRLLLAFETRVLASDPHVWTTDVDPGVQVVPLTELLQQADIVSLHVNLYAETTGFFGKEHFAQMKPGARFVNTARGELVDETALLEALRSSHLSGAALDVLTEERSTGMGNHPLVRYARGHDNLLLTPHIGGCTTESMEKTELHMARKLYDALSGKHLDVSSVSVTEARPA
jgi:D-3-phosphoglycerate dehydrogenase